MKQGTLTQDIWLKSSSGLVKTEQAALFMLAFKKMT
jgi:hypothetical protein